MTSKLGTSRKFSLNGAKPMNSYIWGPFSATIGQELKNNSTKSLADAKEVLR